MNSIFAKSGYTIKRQGLAIAGKYKVFELQGKEPLLYVEEKSKLIPLSIIVHCYTDERKTNEVLFLKDRPNGTGSEMDVFDGESRQKIGSLVFDAESIAEIFKDGWYILDAQDQPIGKFFDKSLGKTMVRDLISHEITQHMAIHIGEICVGEIHQKPKPLGYELELDLSMDVSSLLDHRMGIAIGLLVAYEQGREMN